MLTDDTLLQNRYRVVSLLGQGGMGAIYKAIDERFGSTVALKEMLVTGDQLRKAFEREARLLNNLHHAALPVVIDYFTEGEGAFLIMQFIPGDDLAQMLAERSGPFAPDEVLRWADQLLDALDYLHNHQPPIIHRDIKPQNLKLTGRGQIILLDFGLAKGTAGTSGPGDTSSILGYTPAYAPFEQVRGAGTDARSDLYSLAATVYHMVTNVQPIDAMTRAASILSSEPDPLPALEELNPQVPAAIAAVINKAMALRREHRFDNAVQMRHALKEATRPARDNYTTTVTADGGRETVVGRAAAAGIVESNGPARVTTPQPAPPQPTERAPARPTPSAEGEPVKVGRKLALWVPLILVAILIAVGLGMWLSRRAPTPEAGRGVDGNASATPASTNPGSATPADPLPSSATPGLKPIAFDVVTLDAAGNTVNTSRGATQYFSEDLGAGVMLDMVLVPAGNFVMGSPEGEKKRYGEEGPQHNVEVPSFYMGRFEVTQAQWQAVASLPRIGRDLEPNPSSFEGVNRPVQRVSWDDALEFCARLSKKTGRSYRLPTEAEWEYACRAGTATPFHFGGTITPDLANYDGRERYAEGPKGVYRKQTVVVGSLDRPNAFGLYDMHGNLWEWCRDLWHSDYKGAPMNADAWEAGGDKSKRVLRGGAYNRDPNNCRSAYRLKDSPNLRNDVVGLRVVAGR